MLIGKILAYLAIFIFAFLWHLFINKYLPISVTGSKIKKNNYDERQTTMFQEIFSRTLVQVVYFLIFALLFKLLFVNKPIFQFMIQFPEILVLVVIILLISFNYYTVRRKYTAKG